MQNISNRCMTIKTPVGAGQKSVNQKSDVEIVQLLVNKHINKLKPKRNPLIVTGLCDIQTIQAIKDFQKQVIGFNRPDGRVDPAGKTLKCLNEPLSMPSQSIGRKPIGSSPAGTFSAFIETLELRHISAEELTQGFNRSIHYRSIHADVPKAVGRNSEPPVAIWHNIAPTLIVLDEIREQLGASVTVKNTYRSPEYNEANYIRSKGRKVDKARAKSKTLTFMDAHSGVAKMSQHMIFRAIDFTVSLEKLNEAFRIAKSLRGETFNLPIPLNMVNPRVRKMKYVGGRTANFLEVGLELTKDHFVFRGGVELYTNKFVHIDCRGTDARWIT